LELEKAILVCHQSNKKQRRKKKKKKKKRKKASWGPSNGNKNYSAVFSRKAPNASVNPNTNIIR
jgi:hypothetical protein